MRQIMVGIGENSVSNDSETVIKTILGSCVALIILSPKIRTLGLAHIALPDSKISYDKKRLENLPCYFADIAVPYMIDQFKKRGVVKPSEVIVKLVGGACLHDDKGQFNIGKRNVLAVRKQLWQNRLVPIAEDIGKSYSRRVQLEVKTGKTFVSTPTVVKMRL